MKPLRNSIHLTVLLLVCSLSVLAQSGDTKQFKKDGLSFNYPANWLFNDTTSNQDAQDVQLGRADIDGQIRVWVFRTTIDTPEKMAEAKKVLVDTYVAKTTKDLQQDGGRPQSLPASLDMGGVKAEGVKISASLGGEPGAAEIFWGLVGRRLVVLTFFRPDRALKQMTPAWDTIRNSIAVEETAAPPKADPQAGPKPSPKPTSK